MRSMPCSTVAQAGTAYAYAAQRAALVHASMSAFMHACMSASMHRRASHASMRVSVCPPPCNRQQHINTNTSSLLKHPWSARVKHCIPTAAELAACTHARMHACRRLVHMLGPPLLRSSLSFHCSSSSSCVRPCTQSSPSYCSGGGTGSDPMQYSARSLTRTWPAWQEKPRCCFIWPKVHHVWEAALHSAWDASRRCHACAVCVTGTAPDTGLLLSLWKTCTVRCVAAAAVHAMQ